MSISRKHHYLPKFYLKGFTGNDGKLAVFDLQEKRLLSKRLTPKQVFFEFDRNTFERDGIEDDFVEKLYGILENQIAPVFKEMIRGQKNYSAVSTKDMFNIILFAGSLYWRIPTTDEIIKDVVSSSSPDELECKIIDKETGEEMPLSFHEEFFRKDMFIGAYRMVKPLIDYMKFNIEDINEWLIFYSTLNDKGESKEMHLIGDNPIVFKKNSVINIFDQELIMPLSSGKTLYRTKGKKIELVEPGPRIDVDRLMFLQSEKYVCGPDGDHLKSIAEQAYMYKDIPLHSAIEFLKNRAFNIFHT